MNCSQVKYGILPNTRPELHNSTWDHVLGARWDCIYGSGEQHDTVIKSMSFEEAGSFAVCNVRMSVTMCHGRYRDDTHYRELIQENLSATERPKREADEAESNIQHIF